MYSNRPSVLWTPSLESVTRVTSRGSAVFPFPESRIMKSRRRGFTLIELLIVVVIIGILAAIAVPKYRDIKGRAYAAGLKGDLRNLATAEESYFFIWGTYSTDTMAMSYRTTNGTQLMIVGATAGGWAAIATHPLSYPLVCAFFNGNIAAPAPATSEGVVACQ